MTTKLHAFLRKETRERPYIEEAIVDDVIAFIRPFFRAIRDGSYRLAHANEVDTDLVSEVLASALKIKRGMPVPAAISVSLSRPLLKPAWMTMGDYGNGTIEAAQKPARDALIREIEAGTTRRIAVLLRDKYYRQLARRLSRERNDRLERLIVSDIVDPLMPFLVAALGVTEVGLSKGGEERLRATIRFCLGVSLQLMLGYTILGEREIVYRLAPFVDLLRTTLPIYKLGGGLEEDFGLFIVLCR